jgi:hypothetical protein
LIKSTSILIASKSKKENSESHCGEERTGEKGGVEQTLTWVVALQLSLLVATGLVRTHLNVSLGREGHPFSAELSLEI